MSDPIPQDTKHIWADNFDKLLVTGLFLVMLIVAVLLILKHADDSPLQWIEQMAGNLVAALVALLGGGKVKEMISKSKDVPPNQ